MSFRFHGAAKPEWGEVESVTNELARALDRAGARRISTILVVSTELLENAVKYGRRGAPIELLVESSDEETEIKSRNRVDSAEGPARVRAIIEMVATYENPAEAYLARLQEIYDADEAEGGLGLVRIAGTGPCKLTCNLDDETLEVVAHVPHQTGVDR